MDAIQWAHWASNGRNKTINILTVLGMNSEYVNQTLAHTTRTMEKVIVFTPLMVYHT